MQSAHVQAKISNVCGWTNMVVVTGNVMTKSFLKNIYFTKIFAIPRCICTVTFIAARNLFVIVRLYA